MKSLAPNRYFDDLLNRGDLNTVDEIMMPDIQFHYPLGKLNGANQVKEYIATVRAAFPDINFDVAEYIGDAERVAARWSLSGTQSGPFKGRQPSGTSVNVPGITVFHLSDGKIEEIWISFNPSKLIGGRAQSSS